MSNLITAKKFAKTNGLAEDDIQPVCSHCNKEMKQIIEVDYSAWFTTARLYLCEHCKKPVPMQMDWAH